jgi:hypothetical protein
MHVRMNTIFGERDQATAVVDYLEVLDRPAVEAAVGNGGLMTFIDEASGIVVAASYWDEQARSSAAALTGVRQGAEVVARGMVIADNYEVRGLVRRAVAQRGATVRLDRLQLESAGLDAAIGFLVTVLMAELTRVESLCSAEVLIDAGSSTAIVLTVWGSAQGADSGCSVVESLRDRAADHGAKFVSVERYTLISSSPQLKMAVGS